MDIHLAEHGERRTALSSASAEHQSADKVAGGGEYIRSEGVRTAQRVREHGKVLGRYRGFN